MMIKYVIAVVVSIVLISSCGRPLFTEIEPEPVCVHYDTGYTVCIQREG